MCVVTSHSNIGCDDDAASCVREAAIKFADQNEDGPLDLILRTGRTALARNCRSLLRLTCARRSEDIRRLCSKDVFLLVFYTLLLPLFTFHFTIVFPWLLLVILYIATLH